ncbi:hypothetical protein TUM20983_20390 [Mycobacterium antarcticum]|uniref:WhiB family transcriptional regulator n=1 Tax=Mycolicibacterium sp. TUM20983 TaxID=3023369 RepID=UPI002385864A|nr:WhiB family transcriptional regulator [Mycolicibacterium sp. TUM20983]GLP74929.1 hypothetical protein TUM20983_20390 [Mycolicibacterium sp. TUM20983]
MNGSINLADLLAAMSSGIPALPRAACRERLDVFDSIKPDDIESAIEVCHGCPELQPCLRWAEQSDQNLLTGVIAGRVFKHHVNGWGRPTGITTTKPKEPTMPTPKKKPTHYAFPAEKGFVTGYGYVGETSDDAIMLTAFDADGGPVCLVMPPECARQVITSLAVQIDKQARVTEDGDSK